MEDALESVDTLIEFLRTGVGIGTMCFPVNVIYEMGTIQSRMVDSCTKPGNKLVGTLSATLFRVALQYMYQTQTQN
jgi:hypothetical protein